MIPEAFGKKSALAITGGDQAGLSRALYQTAVGLPHLDAANRKKDHPTVDGVEFNTWKFLSQRSPGGQAAAALYKLERIAAEISHLGIESSKILVSVKDPAPGLDDFVAAAAERLGLGDATVELDDRNVDNAAVIHEEEFAVPSEVEEFRAIVQDRLLPAVGRGDGVRVTVVLSEPAAVRHSLRDELVADLRGRGASVSDGDVVVLSAYRQGYSWIEEVVLPRLLALREDGTPTARVRLLFREHRPPEDWPQQAMHTPLRWQHAMFPADEIMAEALALDLGDVGFELRAEQDAPAYQIVAEGADGEVLLNETFEPRLVSRPFFDRYPDYELIQVTTGGITAEVDGETVVDERIRMDAEAFWDHYQSDTLARLYNYIMELHDGKPRGPADAPYFGQLKDGALALGTGAPAGGGTGDRVHPRRDARGHLLRDPLVPAPHGAELAGHRADLRRPGDPRDAGEDRRHPGDRAHPLHRVPDQPAGDRGGLHGGRRTHRNRAAEHPEG